MLEIRLLGQFDLRQDAEPVEIRSRPAKTLLAYLLLTLGKHHPRGRLAGLLWPDSTENNARKNLRQALWNLRKSIGDEYLLVDNVSITFSPTSGFWLDVNVLEDPAEQNMEMVVPLYEGELLPGYYEDWILLERDRLSAVYERKIQLLLTQLLQEERWTEARNWAEQWIAQGQIPEPPIGHSWCPSQPQASFRRLTRLIKGAFKLCEMRSASTLLMRRKLFMKTWWLERNSLFSQNRMGRVERLQPVS